MSLLKAESLGLHYTIRPALQPFLCEVDLHIEHVEKPEVLLKIALPEAGPIIFNLQNQPLLPNLEGLVSVAVVETSIDISYRIRSLSSDALDWFMYPQGDASYFHCYGDHLLVCPDLPSAEKVSVTLSWEGWPADWVFGNSFGIGLQEQIVHKTLDGLLTTVFVGGDFQIFQSSVDPSITLMTRKQFLPFAQQFLEKAEAII
ncbi:MAG: hypothetical protein LVR00_04420 [Rhabdochlamydiaceae bacterium]